MAPNVKKCDEGMGDGIADDKPQINSTQHACFCNEIAVDEYPDKCDAFCPLYGLTDGRDCACIDYHRAGLNCDEEVCQWDGEAYCKGNSTTTPITRDNNNNNNNNNTTAGLSFTAWNFCETGVNYDRIDDFISCNCTSNEGVVCEGLGFRKGGRPSRPSRPSRPGYRPGGSSGSRGGSADPKTVMIVLGTIAAVTVILLAIYYSWWKRRRLSGAIIYSPAVTGPNPPHPLQPREEPGALPSSYCAPSPAPGQPVSGYDQTSGLATTYTFQPSGGPPLASSAAAYSLPSAPPPQPPFDNASNFAGPPYPTMTTTGAPAYPPPGGAPYPPPGGAPYPTTVGGPPPYPPYQVPPSYGEATKDG